MNSCTQFWIVLLLCFIGVVHVQGHGRLLEPPNRSSIFRFPEFQRFGPPANYDDNQLNCGGYANQHYNNGGKCGICGDPYQDSVPRANEDGGKYGRGIIVRKYKKGEDISVLVNLSANHKGHFEFRLCPQNHPGTPVTQECLDQNLLQIVSPNGSVGTQFPVYAGGINFEMKLKLPPNVTCERCVLQWNYVAGNNWGVCADGVGATGCGPQETFRNCADIAIL